MGDRSQVAILVMAVVLAALVVANVLLAAQVSQLRSQTSSLNSRLESISSELSSGLAAINSTLSRDLGLAMEQVERAANSSSASRYPVILIDALNQTVVIPSQPQRVVTLDPAATETVMALGQDYLLVGVDNNSIYYMPPPYNYTLWNLYRSGEVVDIGSTYSAPSVGEILALRPDLVIGTAGWGYNNYIASELSQYGIPVLLLPSTQSLSDLYRSVVMVGEALGVPTRAAELVNNMTSQIASVEALLYNVSPVNVTVILWINPTYAVGGRTFISSLLMLAGGVNVFHNFTGWPVVSPEQLVASNPCVIILMSNGGLFNRSTLYHWLQSTVGQAYQNICAVREGKVYVVGGWYESVISEPSVMVPLALRLLAEVLHPSAFNLTSIPTYITPSTLSVATH